MISKREVQPPEVVAFEDLASAWRFYEEASWNWTEVYLCDVVAGPLDGSEHLQRCVKCGRVHASQISCPPRSTRRW